MLAYIKLSLNTGHQIDKQILHSLQRDDFLFLAEAPYPPVFNAIYNSNYIFSYHGPLVIIGEESLHLAEYAPTQKKIFLVYDKLADTSILSNEDFVCVAANPELGQLYDIPCKRPQDVKFENCSGNVL